MLRKVPLVFSCDLCDRWDFFCLWKCNFQLLTFKKKKICVNSGFVRNTLQVLVILRREKLGLILLTIFFLVLLTDTISVE